jgi:hypothetical protein
MSNSIFSRIPTPNDFNPRTAQPSGGVRTPAALCTPSMVVLLGILGAPRALVAAR